MSIRYARGEAEMRDGRGERRRQCKEEEISICNRKYYRKFNGLYSYIWHFKFEYYIKLNQNKWKKDETYMHDFLVAKMLVGERQESQTSFYLAMFHVYVDYIDYIFL